MKIVSVSLFGLFFGLTISPGFAQNINDETNVSDDISAYCQLKALESNSEASRLAIPSFIGSASMSPETTYKDDTEDTQRIRIRLGLEYSLRNIKKAELVQKFAKADCDRYRVYRNSMQNIQAQELLTEQSALLAQQKVLVQYLLQFEQTMLNTEKRFYAHNATLKQLDGWQLSVLSLQQKLTELEIQLEDVSMRLGQRSFDSIDKKMSLKTTEQIWQQNNQQEIYTQKLKRKIDATTNWDLKLAAGYEYRNVDTPANIPGFVELTLKYNLGQLLGEKQKINDAHLNWQQTKPTGFLQSTKLKQYKAKKQHQLHKQKYQLINTRLSQLAKQKTLIKSSGNHDTDDFFRKLLLERAQLESQAAYLSALVHKTSNKAQEIENNNEQLPLQMAEFSSFRVSNKPLQSTKNEYINVNSGREIFTGTDKNSTGLRVTSGQVYYDNAQEMYTTTSPTMRVHSSKQGSDIAELKFQYLGTSASRAKLSSGAYRQQVGMFMKSQNQCNRLYIMWRFNAYSSRIVVQTKRNPSMSSHQECGAQGYETVQPQFYTEAPAIEVNQTYKLLTRLSDEKLEIFADEKLVWQGNVDLMNLPGNGYAGVRSDNTNMRFNFEEWNIQ